MNLRETERHVSQVIDAPINFLQKLFRYQMFCCFVKPVNKTHELKWQ